MIGRTLIFQVRRSAELYGSIYGRTVPYKVRQLVRQSSVINLTLFGRKGGKLTSGSVAIVSRIPPVEKPREIFIKGYGRDKNEVRNRCTAINVRK